MKVNKDHSASILANGVLEVEGKWEEDPFPEKFRRFGIDWSNGQRYEIEVSPDGKSLRGDRKVKLPGASPISAPRVDEVQISMWCDDWGNLFVNGKSILQAGASKAESGQIFVKSGDVITIEMSNKGGPMQLGFEAFLDGKKYLGAQEFYYTHKPEKDWKTSPKMEFGYRRPLWEVKRGMVIGEVENPTVAIRQREDEGFQKLYFKFVVR